jgi:hypothetical protein
MHRLAAPFVAFGLVIAGSAAAADDPTALQPHNLEHLNTPKDEDDPHLASNNLRLYYSTNAKGKWDVLVSRRTAGKPWPPGKPMEDINSKADTRSVFVTPEGKYPQRLFFASTKNLDRPNQKGDNYDLFFVTKQLPSSDFTFEEGMQVSSPADEKDPWLMPDGHQLYFSRKTEEGWRVMLASRPKAGGQFGKPQVVELPVGYHHATLTQDGKTMYLQGPLESDRWGLFRTTRQGTSWAEPKPLAGLNHPGGSRGDMSPCLSRDGRYLFFASDRPSGKGGLDIWWIETLELNRQR